MSKIFFLLGITTVNTARTKASAETFIKLTVTEWLKIKNDGSKGEIRSVY